MTGQQMSVVMAWAFEQGRINAQFEHEVNAEIERLKAALEEIRARAHDLDQKAERGEYRFSELEEMASAALSGSTPEEHAMVCPACGKTFDMRDLTQVLAHQVHEPVRELGITGTRVEPKP
jgi:DNA repair exonuclease SbcCD ATPase subunit